MRLRTALFTVTLLILAGSTTLIRSQEAGYLSQKLLLENTIQQRITNAIAKILDESQFVVDVKVELAFTPARQVETVYRTPDGRLIKGEAAQPEGAAPGAEAERAPRTVVNPFPIPGFPDITTEIGEPVRPLEEEAADEALIEGEPGAEAAEITGTTTETTGGLPNIKSLAVNIILEDGVSPQTIENVRQVALIASRFDRDRGDVLSITTASFKDRRPLPEMAVAEAPVTQIQIEQAKALEEKLREAQARNEELMKELRKRELEYLQRSEEERKQALADLAQVQNERAKDLIFLQQQREEQNARLQEALLNQIDELRKELVSGRLPQDEQDIVSFQAASLEDSLAAMRVAFAAEKERLQAQIEAAFAREPPPAQGFAGLSGSNLLLLLGVILLVVLVVVTVILVASRSRAQAAPVGMVYPGPVPPPYLRRRPVPRAAPPARPKRKAKPEEAVEEEAKPEKAKVAPAPPVKEEAAPVAEEATIPEATKVSPATTAEPVPSQVEEDPEVLRSEIKSMRQSVVSMSVGRPESATRILSDWLQQEVAPEAAGSIEAKAPEVAEAEGQEES
ncbi:MAG: flagellar M-ring protein FliF C-terminal domain-containing protein [Candidatus Neomarinimicrobiota bacterium]